MELAQLKGDDDIVSAAYLVRVHASDAERQICLLCVCVCACVCVVRVCVCVCPPLSPPPSFFPAPNFRWMVLCLREEAFKLRSLYQQATPARFGLCALSPRVSPCACVCLSAQDHAWACEAPPPPKHTHTSTSISSSTPLPLLLASIICLPPFFPHFFTLGRVAHFVDLAPSPILCILITLMKMNLMECSNLS